MTFKFQSLPQAARRNFRHRIAWSAFGAASVFLFAAGARAEAPGAQGLYEQRSQTVSFADLDLARSDDARILYWRLQSAARQVCGEPTSRSLRERHDIANCFQGALSKAVEDVGHANLAAQHSGNRSIRVAQRNAAPRS